MNNRPAKLETQAQPVKTLRDEFAMVALAGFMAAEDQQLEGRAHWPENAAALAYRYADAMLAAREAK